MDRPDRSPSPAKPMNGPAPSGGLYWCGQGKAMEGGESMRPDRSLLDGDLTAGEGSFYVEAEPTAARWRSGYAEDCKSLYAGSIPARASSLPSNDCRDHRESVGRSVLCPIRASAALFHGRSGSKPEPGIGRHNRNKENKTRKPPSTGLLNAAREPTPPHRPVPHQAAAEAARCNGGGHRREATPWATV